MTKKKIHYDELNVQMGECGIERTNSLYTQNIDEITCITCLRMAIKYVRIDSKQLENQLMNLSYKEYEILNRMDEIGVIP